MSKLGDWWQERKDQDLARRIDRLAESEMRVYLDQESRRGKSDGKQGSESKDAAE